MGLFDKLESKLEQGVNGAFARAFKAEVQPVEIASGIRRAMDDRAASTKKGKRPIVPNLFTIELAPTDYERLASWGDELDDELIASAQEHCEEQRYLPGGPITIVLAESGDLETGVFRLRPATAKAADALAHQRRYPRPEPVIAHDEPLDAEHVGDNAANASTSSAPARGAHVVTPSATTGATTERSLSERIKSYLRGESAPTPNDQYDIHELHHSDGDHGAHDDDYGYAADGYESDEYDIHTDSAEDEYDEHTRYADADAAEDEWDDEPAVIVEPRREPTPITTSRSARANPRAPIATATETDDPSDENLEVAPARPADRAPRAEQPRPARNVSRVPLPAHTPRTTQIDDDTDPGEATAHFVPETAPARPRAMTPRERPWLKIDGQRYPLLGAITTLGRDDDADIVIDDPGVSRRHSEIRITNDGPHLVMSVRDLHSTNGTFVNGDRIDSQHVRDGDRITVGRTHMTIHLGDRA